jgi:hypothetical protein
VKARARKGRRLPPPLPKAFLDQARPLFQVLGQQGGLTRAAHLSAEERTEQAKAAASKRWVGIPLEARQAQGRAAAQARSDAWRKAGKPKIRRRRAAAGRTAADGPCERADDGAV